MLAFFRQIEATSCENTNQGFLGDQFGNKVKYISSQNGPVNHTQTRPSVIPFLAHKKAVELRFNNQHNQENKQTFVTNTSSNEFFVFSSFHTW